MCSQALCLRYPRIAFKRLAASASNTRKDYDLENRGTEGDDKCNTPVTSKCGLDVRSKEILNLVDDILLSGFSLTDLTEDLMNNV